MWNPPDEGRDGEGRGGRLLGSLQSVLGEARFLGDKPSFAKAALEGSGGLLAYWGDFGLLGAISTVTLSSELIPSLLLLLA